MPHPLGTYLRSRREALGLSRPALAARAGINPATVAMTEEWSLPTEPTLLALCDALGVDTALAWLLWRQSSEAERRRFAVPRPVV